MGRRQRHVRTTGTLGFAPRLGFVVSDQVDLMILPHSQGDPSGTYIESAGLGVPIVDFANAALRGHERNAGFAWTVPVGDIDGLVELVRRLADDAAEVQRKAVDGMDFVARQGFEQEFDARIAQLEAVLERLGHSGRAGRIVCK